MTDEDRAARFYGATDRTVPPTGSSMDSSMRAPAPSLLSGGPAVVSDDDLADRMFGSDATLRSSYGPALADSIARLGDATGMTATEREATTTELARAFSDGRIPAPAAARLTALITHHAVAHPDEAQQQEWYTESNRRLRETYGADGPNRLAIAKAFIKNRPGLAALIERSGVGDAPDLVMTLAEGARSFRIAPPTRTPIGGSHK